MPDHDRIISIGFLSQRDLDILGVGFKRHFPVPDDGAFDDLIARLDGISIDDSRSAPAQRVIAKPPAGH